MTKKSRKLLFIICLVLFLLITPSTLFYSQGYRIDFNPPTGGIKISQTGGLFLKVWPKQVEIYLDSKLKKKTDWFFGSALIENLLPGKYEVLIKKVGFYSWEKILEIKEKEVTETKSIILFPKNPNFTILTNEVKAFWFSPDQKKIVFRSTTYSLFNQEEEWALALYDLERNIKSHLINEKDIHPKGADLLNLEFSSDVRSISLKIGVEEEIQYFDLVIDQIPPTLIESEALLPPLERIIVYQGVNEDIYYLDNSGFLFKTNQALEPKIKITEKPFALLPETEYKLKIFSDFIFLRENQNLYLLNPDSKSFEKFFEPIKDLKLSPDSEKLVYFSDYEIWLLFLKEKRSQPLKKVGEKLFLLRLSETIDDIVWLNSDYLIFNVENKIQIAEVDERDRINIVNLDEFENPKIFFNTESKKLYILSKENLYESPVLLP